MSEQNTADHVWKHIEKERIVLLTTLHGQKIETRPMAAYPDREAGVIRFLTRVDTKKTDDIGRAGPVNIGIADPSANTYLSIAGTGTTSQDRAKIKELWTPYAKAWLDDPEAPDVGLITVELDDAVLWDSTSSSIVSAFEHLRAAVTGGKPNVGTVERIDL